MSSTPNPVYDRLTRGSGWPPPESMHWASCAIFAGGLMLGMLVIVPAMNGVDAPALALIGLAALLVGWYLPVTLIAAAGIAARYARVDDYQMLRLTGLDAQRIVEAHVNAAFFRLRLLRAAALWFPPGSACGMALALSGLLLPVVIPMAAFVWLYLWLMTRTVLIAGTWLGLRWPRRGVMIVGVLAAGWVTVGLATLGPLLPLGLWSQGSVLSALAWYPVRWLPLIWLGLTLALPVFRVVAERAIAADAVRQVSGMSIGEEA